MKNIKLLPKIFATLALLSGALWIGSYLSRIIISYQLFEGNNYSLKKFVTENNLSGILTTINAAIITSTILYLVFLLFFTSFIVSAKINLKQNGWLFISMLIIYLTMPFELYLISIDYKIITYVNSGSFNPVEVLNLIVERFKVLSSFPLIELLSYFSIVYFIVFKPLKSKTQAVT